MVVARDHPPPGQDLEAVGAGHDVFGRVAQVAALHHDVAGPASLQLLGDAAPRRDVGERLDIGPGEDGRLAQVRRDDERVGHQQLEVGLDPRALHQRVPGGGHEDWVDHELGEAPLARQRCHLGHDRRGGQHAGLDAAHGEVVEDRLDLLAHEGRIERDDAAHLGRVLRGDRRQRARAVHAQRGERLEVGLRARAAPRV